MVTYDRHHHPHRARFLDAPTSHDKLAARESLRPCIAYAEGEEVVADMELTADEIKTLRKGLDANPTNSFLSMIAPAHAILDRLSPPEPEQPDEATVWTLKVLTAWGVPEHVLTEITFKTMLANARTVLSELIASKDAEIERLKGEADEGEKLAEQYHNIAEDIESELAALRAENERLKIDNAVLAQSQKPYQAAIGEMFWAAAERNPAEPDILSVRAERALGQIPAPDTAPVVEVAQADRLRLQSWWSSKGMAIEVAERLVSQRADEDTFLQLLARHRTEAEARGRRQALEEARKNIRDRLYPKNPESDWTPYARDRAAAANSADDELRYLLNGGRRP